MEHLSKCILSKNYFLDFGKIFIEDIKITKNALQDLFIFSSIELEITLSLLDRDAY